MLFFDKWAKSGQNPIKEKDNKLIINLLSLIYVPRIGLEPTRLSTLAPETSASTISPPGPLLRCKGNKFLQLTTKNRDFFRIIYVCIVNNPPQYRQFRSCGAESGEKLRIGRNLLLGDSPADLVDWRSGCLFPKPCHSCFWHGFCKISARLTIRARFGKTEKCSYLAVK